MNSVRQEFGGDGTHNVENGKPNLDGLSLLSEPLLVVPPLSNLKLHDVEILVSNPISDDVERNAYGRPVYTKTNPARELISLVEEFDGESGFCAAHQMKEHYSIPNAKKQLALMEKTSQKLAALKEHEPRIIKERKEIVALLEDITKGEKRTEVSLSSSGKPSRVIDKVSKNGVTLLTLDSKDLDVKTAWIQSADGYQEVPIKVDPEKNQATIAVQETNGKVADKIILTSLSQEQTNRKIHIQEVIKQIDESMDRSMRADALVNLYRGLLHLADHKDFAAAKSSFEQALKRDPSLDQDLKDLKLKHPDALSLSALIHLCGNSEVAAPIWTSNGPKIIAAIADLRLRKSSTK